MTALDKHFTASLQKSPTKGGWTYVVMPGSAGKSAGDVVSLHLTERLTG